MKIHFIAVRFESTRRLIRVSSLLLFLSIYFIPPCWSSDGNVTWEHFLTGTGTAWGRAVGVDGSGNVYTTGYFQGTLDFDPGGGTYQLTANQSVFVQKLDHNGEFIWAGAAAGSTLSMADGIAVAADGSVYTTGYFQGSVDFDPGPEVHFLTATQNDVFIQKWGADGSLVWAYSLGLDNGFGRDIALDATGNVYVTGLFFGSGDFDPGAGTATLTSAGERDVFILKLDTTGTFVWARSISGTDYQDGICLRTDSNGNVYTKIRSRGEADFDPGAGTYNLTSAGDADIFIQKMDSAGNFLWATTLPNTFGDQAHPMALDPNGNIISVGSFQGTVDFDSGPGEFSLTSDGWGFFIQKLDANGAFVWARMVDFLDTGSPSGACVDALGSVYFFGSFVGELDFDPGIGVFNLSSNGNEVNTFTLKLDADGEFMWAQSMDGPTMNTSVNGWDIETDGLGNIFETGLFNGGSEGFLIRKLGDTPYNDDCGYKLTFAEEWTLMAVDLGLTDDLSVVPQNVIPERWGVAMVRSVLCNPNHPHYETTLAVYANNLSALENESAPIASRIAPYKHILAALLLINQSRRDYFAAILELQNSYETVEGPARVASDEYFADDGDLDGDNTTNVDEYVDVTQSAGTMDSFAYAASSGIVGLALDFRGLMFIMMLFCVVTILRLRRKLPIG